LQNFVAVNQSKSHSGINVFQGPSLRYSSEKAAFQLHTSCFVWLLVFVFVLGGTSFAQEKPKLTIDEFFDAVSFDGVKVSPDGNSVVIATEAPDWDKSIFRKDLWLYRNGSSAEKPVRLTQSGRDKQPEWSPDGRWVAFLSERDASGEKSESAEDDSDGDKKDSAQLFLISPTGGEAYAVTSGKEEVHAFAWAADSKAIYFATREPWTKQQAEDHKKDWKDVSRYRGDERGDFIYRLDVQDALARAISSKPATDAEKDSGSTPGAATIARSPLRVSEISVARDGKRLAFLSSSISERQEKIGEFDIYMLDLTAGAAGGAPVRLTQNEAVEVDLNWAPDNRHIFFRVNLGSLEKKYEDPQPRLYWIDAEGKSVERWFASFPGEVVHYAVLPDGSALCACRLGTETQLYTQAAPKAGIEKRDGWAGTYEGLGTSRNSPQIALVYSAIDRPSEVYLADASDRATTARTITSFNRIFTEKDLPKAKPYQWTSPDGTRVEGMLMYPPGKYETKNLPTFVFIHGGPQDADGNHFEADWYQWDRLAATDGWLVFEPNYRGSTGYGDKFALAIVPEMVSAPGRDILAGVDALVKEGIADPNHLAIGGYSYGGYMTNWLITQTTRFKAAVTGAGAVENVANWGNDDTTMDDAYFLGGLPWQVPNRYHSEAAIYQIDKVRTPTHMVAGENDIRVAVLEDYLLDRALHELGVPSELLLFPGEGHDLIKNPWHGKIKVREELQWLRKYGRSGEHGSSAP
jgi:dipeptidyl aminopeptidase/acylaminoacyl peptidase